VSNWIAATYPERLVVVPHMDADAVLILIPHFNNCAVSSSRPLKIAGALKIMLRVGSLYRHVVTSLRGVLG
jgi:hypothetical protein